MIPTTEELRAQCRVDIPDDDALLALYANAARRRAENYINRPLFDDAVPEDQAEGLIISDDIKLAIMLAVGHWYEHRSDVSEGQYNTIPLGFKSLLDPYRFIPL